MKEERTIVIDIKLTGRLVVVLSCGLTIAALLAYLALTGASAVASGEASLAQSSGMRQFYLTTAISNGDGALNACAEGYHLASLWELADPSNLKYNTSLGWTEADSGQGPSSTLTGWVRTGYQSEASSTTPGQANCAVWTSSHESDHGTVARLTPDWTAGYQDMGIWDVFVLDCNLFPHVWCIED